LKIRFLYPEPDRKKGMNMYLFCLDRIRKNMLPGKKLSFINNFISIIMDMKILQSLRFGAYEE
jgi:hypothetical protein